ncbi:MAG: class I SAM-dependent methyltransferase [Arcicella sp.]|jgi:2-polyprenyl-3-methyl-5-hydroxy-6-metoxy-1,4-benzoquinol methylase|nr:class I SAM-dependent methyltransferase [Arcicella sp.]
MTIAISPLTGKTDVLKEQVLNIPTVKAKYIEELNTDVSRFFENVEELAIYQCQTSKLRFYHPFSVVSDGQFYADLAKFYKGYYNPWRWEHQQVIEMIQPQEKVLEIGCGRGYFLQKLLEKQAIPTGLDFNEDAIKDGKQLGITILNQTIKEHAQTHTESYDSICAFQLFEHVNEVGDFLIDTIKCLKKGGLLAIGVPNNNSYYFKNDVYHTLNLPPHHMLLWDKNSLSYIAEMFDLEVIEIVNQPVNSLHRGMIYKLWVLNIFGNNLLSKIITMCTRFVIKRLPLFNNQGITVVATFRKK